MPRASKVKFAKKTLRLVAWKNKSVTFASLFVLFLVKYAYNFCSTRNRSSNPAPVIKIVYYF